MATFPPRLRSELRHAVDTARNRHVRVQCEAPTDHLIDVTENIVDNGGALDGLYEVIVLVRDTSDRHPLDADTWDVIDAITDTLDRYGIVFARSGQQLTGQARAELSVALDQTRSVATRIDGEVATRDLVDAVNAVVLTNGTAGDLANLFSLLRDRAARSSTDADAWALVDAAQQVLSAHGYTLSKAA